MLRHLISIDVYIVYVCRHSRTTENNTTRNRSVTSRHNKTLGEYARAGLCVTSARQKIVTSQLICDVQNMGGFGNILSTIVAMKWVRGPRATSCSML